MFDEIEVSINTRMDSSINLLNLICKAFIRKSLTSMLNQVDAYSQMNINQLSNITP